MLLSGSRATYPAFITTLAGRHLSSTQGQKPTWQHPARGGQNLTDRYHRLERSLRGKEAYKRNIVDLTEEAGSPTPARLIKSNSRVKTFMGYVIPEEPKAPEPDECCMSGCAVCVLDLYAEALDEYKQAVDTLHTSLTALKIPEDQWPKEIRTTERPKKHSKSTALSAFEALEQQLREKQAAGMDAAGG